MTSKSKEDKEWNLVLKGTLRYSDGNGTIVGALDNNDTFLYLTNAAKLADPNTGGPKGIGQLNQEAFASKFSCKYTDYEEV